MPFWLSRKFSLCHSLTRLPEKKGIKEFFFKKSHKKRTIESPFFSSQCELTGKKIESNVIWTPNGLEFRQPQNNLSFTEVILRLNCIYQNCLGEENQAKPKNRLESDERNKCQVFPRYRALGIFFIQSQIRNELMRQFKAFQSSLNFHYSCSRSFWSYAQTHSELLMLFY